MSVPRDGWQTVSLRLQMSSCGRRDANSRCSSVLLLLRKATLLASRRYAALFRHDRVLSPMIQTVCHRILRVHVRRHSCLTHERQQVASYKGVCPNRVHRLILIVLLCAQERELIRAQQTVHEEDKSSYCQQLIESDAKRSDLEKSLRRKEEELIDLKAAKENAEKEVYHKMTMLKVRNGRTRSLSQDDDALWKQSVEEADTSDDGTERKEIVEKL